MHEYTCCLPEAGGLVLRFDEPWGGGLWPGLCLWRVGPRRVAAVPLRLWGAGALGVPAVRVAVG